MLYLSGAKIGGEPALWGTWAMAKPVRLNDDYTVSLADDPTRLLCVPTGADPNGPVFFSNGTSKAGRIRIDFPLPQPDKGGGICSPVRMSPSTADGLRVGEEGGWVVVPLHHDETPVVLSVIRRAPVV